MQKRVSFANPKTGLRRRRSTTRKSALLLSRRATERLEQEHAVAGKAKTFGTLKGFLCRDAPVTYEQAADALGASRRTSLASLTGYASATRSWCTRKSSVPRGEGPAIVGNDETSNAALSTIRTALVRSFRFSETTRVHRQFAAFQKRSGLLELPLPEIRLHLLATLPMQKCCYQECCAYQDVILHRSSTRHRVRSQRSGYLKRKTLGLSQSSLSRLIFPPHVVVFSSNVDYHSDSTRPLAVQARMSLSGDCHLKRFPFTRTAVRNNRTYSTPARRWSPCNGRRVVTVRFVI